MTTYKFIKMGMHNTHTERNRFSLLYNLSHDFIPSQGKYSNPLHKKKKKKKNQKWSSRGGELGVGF